MLYRLTKSKFILGLQCEKALYLDIYKPQLAYHSPETLCRFRMGRDFEAKIKSQFDNGIDISQILRGNIQKYPELTSQYLSEEGEKTLFEAGFVYNEVLVLADVVHKTAKGDVTIYEIKNSTSVKTVFQRDVCIQNYVIDHCIDKLVSFQLIYNDGNDNPLYHELLPYAKSNMPLIAQQVERFKAVIQGLEPDIVMGEQCLSPYECPFSRYCKGMVSTQTELAL